MTPRYLPTWALRFSGAAVAVSVVFLVSVAWRATHYAVLPAPTQADQSLKIRRPDFYRGALPSELAGAVDSDPFRQDRSRPPIRYQLPGTAAPAPKETAPVAPPIVLLGTLVVGGEGHSFAMCQTPAGPRIVHIGEKLGDLTLKRVGKQSAVFVSSSGKEVSVSVKPAGT